MAEPTRKTLADLVAVMAALRTPVTGCPWDLEQDFRSIAPYTIEEAYEVADAIARDNLADLKEELGDLLLQVVYHARLAEEEGAFALPEVVDGITRKMIRRHPHVFGDETARSATVAKDFWERIKAQEKAEKAALAAQIEARNAIPGRGARTVAASPSEPAGLLSDVPVGLPALTRAIKLQEKAARVGFDWPSLAPVLDKVKEELAEFEEVALAADPRAAERSPHAPPPERLTEEFGDLMFVMANVARHLKIDPEAATRAANEKFTRRFRFIEQRLAGQGKTPAQSDLAEMDRLWNEAKAQEKAHS